MKRAPNPIGVLAVAAATVSAVVVVAAVRAVAAAGVREAVEGAAADGASLAGSALNISGRTGDWRSIVSNGKRRSVPVFFESRYPPRVPFSRNARKRWLRLGWRSLRSAFASI